MKIKTNNLTGAALNWAVAKCEETIGLDSSERFLRDHRIGFTTSYFANWSQGGPIIEREGILLRPLRRTGHSMDGLWLAMYDGSNTGTIVQWVKRTNWPRHYLEGPTALIAAMRCYVASKLGNEVNVPEELL